MDKWAEIFFWGVVILFSFAFLAVFITACVKWILGDSKGVWRTMGKGVIALSGYWLYHVWTTSESPADFKLGMAVYFGVYGLACLIILCIIGVLFSMIPRNQRDYPRKMKRKTRKRYDEGRKAVRHELAKLLDTYDIEDYDE